MIANPDDQRTVRGHDFLAYFRSHLMTICLIFWFFTISASATAVSIYLIKKIAIESKTLDTQRKEQGFVGTTDAADRLYNKLPDESAYEEYNVLGFLVDAMYIEGDEEGSKNRSQDASAVIEKLIHRKSTKKTPKITSTTDYDYPEDVIDPTTEYDYYQDESDKPNLVTAFPDMDYGEEAGTGGSTKG